MTSSPTIPHSLSRILFSDDEEDTSNTTQNDSEMDKHLGNSMPELGQIAILSSSKASLNNKPRKKRNTFSASKARAESFRFINTTNMETVVEDDVPTKSCCLAKIKGSLFGILSALFFVSSNVVMKRSIHMSPTDHSTIYYAVTLVMMVIICRYKKMKILGPRRHFKLLLVRGMLGSLSLFPFYYSVILLDPSDSSTLFHSSLIITAVISRLFLGEKLTLAHFM